jgi:hypothetical protein
MPYAHIKKKIPRELDRRVKITELTRENIHTMYFFERLPQRAIARRTGVSRRMVSFILFPERLVVARAQHKERRLDGRYKPPKKEWAAIIREHRTYKERIKKSLID